MDKPEKPKRAPQFFTVPAGTPAKQCKSETCAKVIYWITTKAGRRMPVDCDVEGGVRPTPIYDPRQLDAFKAPGQVTHDGRGRSHFETCKDAARFRGD